MLLKSAEIARMCGVSRAAINKFLTENGVTAAGTRGKRGLYDISVPPLAGYIARKRGGPLAAAPGGSPAAEPAPGEPPSQSREKGPQKRRKPAAGNPPEAPKKPSAPDPPPVTSAMETPETAPAPAAARFQELPLNEFFKKILQDGKALSSSFYGEAYKLAKKEGLDTPEFYLKMGDRAAREEINARVAMASIEKERARERYEAGRAARINLENDIRRGLFVAKEKVALVMGRVYAVHTSQLQALGARLAAEVAADLGVETAAGVLKARKRIEEEVYAVLKAIQGLLADYVEGAL